MIPDEADTAAVKEAKGIREMTVILCPECYGTYNFKCELCKGRQMMYFTEAIIRGVSLEKCMSNTYTVKEVMSMKEEEQEKAHGY
jgi:hypothetical protein